MSRSRIIALLLALVTLVVFLPVRSFQFINYDDDDYITNNRVVQNGLTLAGVKWAFTTTQADNWHPLTWLSHMTDCELFKLNAGAHHLVNVLFHALNAALLFVLLRRLTGKTWPAAFIAALFAWHPLHVESVAWVSERKDVLSTCFALLSLLAYANYVAAAEARNPKSRFFYLASLGLFALGLLSKPMLVTLPCVMLLLDYWPLKRFGGSGPPTEIIKQQLLENFPFFLLVAISCVLTFAAQSQNLRGNAAVMSLEIVPLHYRLKNVPVAYATYLLKFIWPANLAVFYPLPKIIPPARAAAAVLVLLLVSAAAWRWRKSRPYLAVGWLWFLGMLMPVNGLVQVGGTALADRYSYLPMVGIFIIIAFAASEAATRFPATRMFFCAGAAVVLAGCIFATERQLSFWKDSETLFRHALAVTEDNDVAHDNLGFALQDRGDLAGAFEQYRAAAELDPLRVVTHNNLASLLDQLGRPAEALGEYREAIRLRPGDSALHTGAGYELNVLGRFDAALEEFATAEKLDPQYSWPHVEAAQVCFKLGRDAEAVDELRAALRIAPNDYKILAETAHYLAANENPAARDGKNAVILALKANEISGRVQPVVFDALGMAFAENGDYASAVTCAQDALDLATAAKMKNTEPLQRRLELYQNHQPWHESFRITNAPAKN
jgi:protein O-mannosyl-transferase